MKVISVLFWIGFGYVVVDYIGALLDLVPTAARLDTSVGSWFVFLTLCCFIIGAIKFWLARWFWRRGKARATAKAAALATV